MNQSLHAICHTQRVKTIVTCAVIGGALCVACAAVTLADDLFEPSSVDRPLKTVNSPARWADLSSPNARQQPTAVAAAVDPPRFDFDRPWTAPQNISASVHVGPAPAAFTSESFRGARHVAATPPPRQLRPIRLPPTGYFDESAMSARIATGPSDSPLPRTSQHQSPVTSSFE